MMGRVAAARAELFAVLEPILPGRVYAYPATAPAPTAPAVYVETSDGAWSDGQFVAMYRVRVVADGADRAAHAQLDELLDAVYDACAASANCYPDGYTFEPFDVDAATSLPGYTFAVAVDMASSTWCRPDAPAAVPIPVPIGV
jgi:hypothetical protein